MSFYIGLLLLAFSISPLSVMFTERLFGPNFVEPFMFAGVCLVWSNAVLRIAFRNVVFSPIFIVSAFFILLQFVIGGVVTGELAYVYADFRTNLLLVFSCLFFRQAILLRFRSGQIIKFLFWSIIIMDLLYSVLYLNMVLTGLESQVKIRMISPISCVILMYLYEYRWKNVNAALLLFLILGYHTIVSAMRNFYIILFVALIILLFGLLRNKISKLHKIAIVALLILIPVFSWQGIYEFWMSDGSRQIHTINRVEETLSGENREHERVNSITVPLMEPLNYLFPKGIGWRGYVETIQQDNKQSGILSTMDSCFYYLAYHYGLVILFVLIALLLYMLITNVVLLSWSNRVVWSSFLLLFLTAFFTQATMFAYISFSFNYGLLIAFLMNSFCYEDS